MVGRRRPARSQPVIQISCRQEVVELSVWVGTGGYSCVRVAASVFGVLSQKRNVASRGQMANRKRDVVATALLEWMEREARRK